MRFWGGAKARKKTRQKKGEKRRALNDKEVGNGQEEEDDQVEETTRKKTTKKGGSGIMAKAGIAAQSRHPRHPKAQGWPLSGPRCGYPSIMHFKCSIGCW